MPLDPPPLKVACARGAKHSQAVCTGTKGKITVLASCSAGGQVLPPLVIFKGKTLKPALCTGEVRGTRYGLSANGWIDTQVFEDWFAKHFLAYALPIRPLLLLLDGHSSHYQTQFIERAASEQIIVFCPPPHTTHLTQPLDKGCFGPLKMAWRQVCRNYLASNPGKVISKYQFSQLFHEAWDVGMFPQNVISGFRVTGVYPFDRYVATKKKEKKSLADKNGLAYIPVFTPRKQKCSVDVPRRVVAPSDTVAELIPPTSPEQRRDLERVNMCSYYSCLSFNPSLQLLLQQRGMSQSRGMVQRQRGQLLPWYWKL